MFSRSLINWITNLFGAVAGVPELIEGYLAFKGGDIGQGIMKIAEGAGILVVAYFVGKKAVDSPGAVPGMMRMFFLISGFSLLFPITGHAATLQWDRNTEADMKEYEVYTCTPNPTCTVLQTVATRIGVVSQPVVGVVPVFVLPPNTEGKVAVSASDVTGNESGLSVSIPFDAKAPVVPINPRLVP